jgi:hypothetical protein
MTVTTSWTDPSTKDKAVGATLPAADVNIISSCLNAIGGSDGNSKTGQYRTVPYNAGSITGATTIDWDNGSVQYATVTGAPTFTLSNPLDGAKYTLILTQSGGSFANVWPAAVHWPGAAAPTQSANGRVDIYCLQFRNATYYAAALLNYVA